MAPRPGVQLHRRPAPAPGRVPAQAPGSVVPVLVGQPAKSFGRGARVTRGWCLGHELGSPRSTSYSSVNASTTGGCRISVQIRSPRWPSKRRRTRWVPRSLSRYRPSHRRRPRPRAVPWGEARSRPAAADGSARTAQVAEARGRHSRLDTAAAPRFRQRQRHGREPAVVAIARPRLSGEVGLGSRVGAVEVEVGGPLKRRPDPAVLMCKDEVEKNGAVVAHPRRRSRGICPRRAARELADHAAVGRAAEPFVGISGHGVRRSPARIHADEVVASLHRRGSRCSAPPRHPHGRSGVPRRPAPEELALPLTKDANCSARVGSITGIRPSSAARQQHRYLPCNGSMIT